MTKKINPHISPFLFYPTKLLTNIVFKSLYRIEIKGRENIPSGTPYIMTPKHQYWTDIPIIAISVNMPMFYVAKVELFKNPFLNFFLSHLGGIPINRRSPSSTKSSFRSILNLINERKIPIVIFPEGTYYPDKIGPPRPGLIQMILKYQKEKEKFIPFIPVGIKYKKGKPRESIMINIGLPISINDKIKETSFVNKIMQEIAKLSNL